MTTLRHLSLLAFLLIAVNLFTGCKTTRTDDYTYTPSPVMPKKLGPVEFVDMTEGFVLVRLNFGYTVEPGTKMYAFDSDGKVTALLNRHPDEKKPFVVADIVKGKPQAGNSVMVYPDPDLAPNF